MLIREIAKIAKELKEIDGFISFNIDSKTIGGKVELHLSREDFKELKTKIKADTTIENTLPYSIKEKMIIEGVTIFSLLDENEYKMDFQLVEVS